MLWICEIFTLRVFLSLYSDNSYRIVVLNSVALADIKSALRREASATFPRDKSKIVQRAYLDSLLTISAQVHRLSDDNELALKSLRALQGRLLTIRGLVTARALTLEGSDDVLSSLWQKLRPHRKGDSQISRLKGISTYLGVTADRLETASQLVQSMKDLMEGMWPIPTGSKTETCQMTVVPQVDRIETMLEVLQQRRKDAEKESEEIVRRVLLQGEEGAE